MRMRLAIAVTFCGLGGLATLGCVDKPKRPTIVPPKEEFHVPPEHLFRGPVQYPKEMLNNVQPRRPKDDEKFVPPASMNGGGGGGMGGPAGP